LQQLVQRRVLVIVECAQHLALDVEKYFLDIGEPLRSHGGQDDGVTATVPHLDAASGLAPMVPPQDHTPAQASMYARSVTLIDEIKQADTVLLGVPLYNFGPPSAIKAWVDHLIVPGLSFDPATHTGMLDGTEFIVLASRGGGYGAGTPREGWDHSETWLPHGLMLTGLEPRIITAELTMAEGNPAMAELRPLAAQSLADAEAAIDELWAAARVVA
jgi:FMN-dependent NADH-azoreductase